MSARIQVTGYVRLLWKQSVFVFILGNYHPWSKSFWVVHSFSFFLSHVLSITATTAKISPTSEVKGLEKYGLCWLSIIVKRYSLVLNVVFMTDLMCVCVCVFLSSVLLHWSYPPLQLYRMMCFHWGLALVLTITLLLVFKSLRLNMLLPWWKLV